MLEVLHVPAWVHVLACRGPLLDILPLASLPDIHSLWVDVWGVRLRAVQSRCDAMPGNLHLILHPFLDGVLAPAPNFRSWGSGDRSNVDRELIGGSEVCVGAVGGACRGVIAHTQGFPKPPNSNTQTTPVFVSPLRSSLPKSADFEGNFGPENLAFSF